MIVSQQRILFILVVFTLLSLSLQKEEEEECYKISTIHFKDDHCSQTPSSYEQLKTFSKLCGNIAYLGYHEKQEKYFFLTNEFNLIGFEDESNVWTKAIEHPDMKKYNFTIIKSQLLEKHLYLLALHNDFYYLIIVEISKGDKVINSSILKFGHKDMVFPNLECDNIYFIKVERGDTVYLNKGINFQQEKLKIYNQNITLLKQIKPSKFEVFTIDGRTEVLACNQCLLSKKKTMEKFENNQSKADVIQINLGYVGIVIALIIICASLLIVIIVSAIIYFYRRCEKKRAKRNEIKYIENDELLKGHSQKCVTSTTQNISSVPQNISSFPPNESGIPDNNDTLADSKL